MSRALMILAVLALPLGVTGCIGSPTPRYPGKGKALEKPYVPPINPKVLIPASIQAADIRRFQTRKAIERSLANPYENSWRAHDTDVKRINDTYKDEALLKKD